MISHISIEGYKSIREMRSLSLGALNILIGANGSGKSNFLDFFELLHHVVFFSQGNQDDLEYYIDKKGGPDSFLHYGRKRTDSISARLGLATSNLGFTMFATADNKLKLFSKDIGFVSQQKPIAGVREQEPDGFADLVDNWAPEILRWSVYHFNDTGESAPVKGKSNVHDNRDLRPDAQNLAAFLYNMRATSPRHYNAVKKTVRLASPTFGDFALSPDPHNPAKIELKWTERGSDYPFLAHQLSDGTLRFMCLSTLLLQPDPPSLIILDEPELGLHPHAISLLAEMITAATTRSQIIASTQSVSFVDEFTAAEIITVVQDDNQSVFRRLDTGQLRTWLEEYSIGELWQKNVIFDRDPHP